MQNSTLANSPLHSSKVSKDEACRDSIPTNGSDKVNLPWQTANSVLHRFATYPLTHSLAGTGLAKNVVAGGDNTLPSFDDGHHRQFPLLVSGPFRYQTYASEYLKRSLPMAKKPTKQAVIASSMLYLLYPLDKEIEGYSIGQFEEDIVNECENDIRQSFAGRSSPHLYRFHRGRKTQEILGLVETCSKSLSTCSCSLFLYREKKT